jgi:DNA-directed RNA polymerase specialized sigma24 family protein
MDWYAQTLKQLLTELRQFAFVMTGDEETADVIVAEVLASALDQIDEAARYPCHRSWMFANLSRALEAQSFGLLMVGPPVQPCISFLQIPPAQRAVVVLVDGFKFDIPTVALISGTSVPELEQMLSSGRLCLDQLVTGAFADQQYVH